MKTTKNEKWRFFTALKITYVFLISIAPKNTVFLYRFAWYFECSKSLCFTPPPETLDAGVILKKYASPKFRHLRWWNEIMNCWNVNGLWEKHMISWFHKRVVLGKKHKKWNFFICPFYLEKVSHFVCFWLFWIFLEENQYQKRSLFSSFFIKL